MGWLLVLGLKEGLVECATACIKSEVILSQVDVGIVVVKVLLQQRFMTLKSTLGTTVRMFLQILIMVESLSTGMALLY